MNSNTFLFMTVMVISWMAVIAALSFTPFFIRKTVAFGISVPESAYQKPFLSTLRRRYCLVSLLLGLIFGAGSMLPLLSLGEDQAAWLQLIAILAYLLVEFVLYLICYRKVRRYKQENNWETSRTVTAPLTEGADGKKPMRWAWYLLHLAVVIATAGVGIFIYPGLPEQLPMHYNMAGQVDRYTDKSWGTVLLMPAIQLLMALLFLGIHLAIGRTKNQPDAPGKTSGFQKSAAFKRIMDQSLFAIGLLTLLILGMTQLTILGLLSDRLMMLLPALILIPILVLVAVVTVRVGQGGSRIRTKMNREENATAVENDSVWKLGFFYVNPADPSLFVEKRFGIGFTVNFGNPKCWIIFAGLAAILAGTLILPFVLK